jgi:hypothetical protein
MLNLHRRLLASAADPALVTGAYQPVEADGDVLAYLRPTAPDRCLVALNLGPARHAWPSPPAGRPAGWRLAPPRPRRPPVAGAALPGRGVVRLDERRRASATMEVPTAPEDLVVPAIR